MDELNVRVHDDRNALSCVRKERDETSNRIVEIGKEVVVFEEKFQATKVKHEEMMV